MHVTTRLPKNGLPWNLIWAFFKNLLKKSQVSLHLTRTAGTLHEDQYKFFIISHSILPRKRTVSFKSCKENQNTHFMFSNFFWKLCHYEMWSNTVQSGRPWTTIWCMCIAYWLTKATNTHSEYVILTAIFIGIAIQITSPLSFNGLKNVTMVIQNWGAFSQYQHWFFSLLLNFDVKTVLPHQVSKLQQQNFSSYTSSITAVLKS